jgi:hypothetical protein
MTAQHLVTLTRPQDRRSAAGRVRDRQTDAGPPPTGVRGAGWAVCGLSASDDARATGYGGVGGRMVVCWYLILCRFVYLGLIKPVFRIR